MTKPPFKQPDAAAILSILDSTIDNIKVKLGITVDPNMPPRRKKHHRCTFHAYLCYSHEGKFLQAIESSSSHLEAINPLWTKNALNGVSASHGRYAGCSCYGFFWRRQINKDDPIPKTLDDALLANYKRKKGNIVLAKSKKTKKKNKTDRKQFDYFICYNLDGSFYKLIKNDDDKVKEVNPLWRRRSLINVSSTKPFSYYAGKTRYGYFWRRLINKNDPYPKQLNDDYFNEYKPKGV